MEEHYEIILKVHNNICSNYIFELDIPHAGKMYPQSRETINQQQLQVESLRMPKADYLELHHQEHQLKSHKGQNSKLRSYASIPPFYESSNTAR
ncbi:hypothetical protein AMS66_18515 [Paenibacillus xylanivorans]|uniref:Uncharacterized protein n=1 Tax=Paenibacillus xylanivorans TaxID=1705561 RepID=A0A0M9BLY4_9BACL|nr:hypothetical protein AMS66_18515 [Paenibacillus xylanivorans]